MSVMFCPFSQLQLPPEVCPNVYVEIVRTGAYLLPVDKYGRVHMGGDAFRNGLLTLPGGNVEASDRNLYAAARRETGQEFGRHMRYRSNASKPLVFLCCAYDDSWVRIPRPGQKVKLRVVFPVFSLTDDLPREQRVRKPEVLNPRPYFVFKSELGSMPLREPTRIALTLAFSQGILSPAPLSDEHPPELLLMQREMLMQRVPPAVVEYHCSRRTRRLTPETEVDRTTKVYLASLEKAGRERSLLRA